MSFDSKEIPFSHKIANGGSLTIAGKLVCRCLDLITLAILSRLLSPADFGLTALAMTSVIIAETVTSLPLAAALLRVSKPTKAMYDTAFTLAFLRGILLALILSALGFVMMFIYDEPRLVALVMALSIAPILRGLLSPRMVDYMREMNFIPEAGIEIAGKTAALAASCALAFSTHSYWAIAVSTITTPFVMNLLSYRVAPYRPRFCLSEWVLFKNYVGWNSLTQLIGALKWQMDKLLLGYFVPKATLGQYTMASDLNNIPLQSIVVPLKRPVLASYSARGVRLPEELAKTYLKTSNAMLAFAGPVFVGLALLAVPAVYLVLGPKWAEAGSLLQWIALAALLTLPVINLDQLALTLDEARMLTWRTVLEFCVVVPLLFFGCVTYGVMGVVGTRIIGGLFTVLVSMEAVRKLIGCSFVCQIMVLRRTVLALLVMGGSLWLLRPLVVMDGSVIVLALSLAGVGLVGLLFYIGALAIFWRLAGYPAGIEAVVWGKGEIIFSQIKRRLVS